MVKANPSRWAREKVGYGVFSVSESNVPAVSKYIATQEEHHRNRSFEEEFLAFLSKNRIAYDKQYLQG